MEKTIDKNNDIFEMVKLGLILVIYAVISCTVLALVNNWTLPRIVQNQINKANTAMKNVFPEADSFVAIKNFPPSKNAMIKISDVYLAKNGDDVLGAVCQVSGPTYDKAKIIMGLKNDNTVSGVEFLELSDSPGFGLKAKDATWTFSNGKTFYGQFQGKDATNGFSINNNFDAISGATITSRGVGDLLTEGSKVLHQVQIK